MELVESYVHEVSRFLPEDQRSEISADLRASIEEELGVIAEERPIDDAAVRGVLAGFGHPLKVAGQYQPARYLIGPELYPVFGRTLRTVTSIAAVIYVLVALGLGYAEGWTVGPIGLFVSFLEIALWVFLIVLGIFFALEVGGERFNWYEGWSPQSVKPGLLGVIDHADVVTNLVTEGFFLLWWNGVILLSNALPDGAVVLTLAPVWGDFALYLNVIFGAAFLLHGYVLVQGLWSQITTVAELTVFAAMAGLGLALLGQPHLVDVASSADSAIGPHVQTVVKVGIGIVVALTVWDIYIAFRRWIGRAK